MDVDINEGIVCCGKPAFGPCKPKCYPCTTEENEEITNSNQTDETDLTDKTEIIDH
ncbi:MAG: hypothetical protein GX092_06250 [Clostridia bacterium]|nr:hypothetical protein [Clostridia bacterium]